MKVRTNVLLCRLHKSWLVIAAVGLLGLFADRSFGQAASQQELDQLRATLEATRQELAQARQELGQLRNASAAPGATVINAAPGSTIITNGAAATYSKPDPIPTVGTRIVQAAPLEDYRPAQTQTIIQTVPAPVRTIYTTRYVTPAPVYYETYYRPSSYVYSSYCYRPTFAYYPSYRHYPVYNRAYCAPRSGFYFSARW